jgi:PIN domain nuclease of toxin-antitoxin system
MNSNNKRTSLICRSTNAIIFLLTHHKESKALEPLMGELRASLIKLMELQMLVEVGKLRWKHQDPRGAFREDSRWAIDDPQVGVIAYHALDIGSARDPFDRLLVAHARHRRWRLATSDSRIIENLTAKQVVAL